MVVFISGPMTGMPDFNRAAFFRAQEFLEENGFTVLNPAILPTDLPETAYMPICLAMLDQCDCFFMLDGWVHSEGAGIELSYAMKQGKYRLIESEGVFRHEEAEAAMRHELPR